MTNLLGLFGTRGAEPLALSLIYFLWQGTLVAVAASVTLRLLARSSAAVRYVVACAFLAGMVILPVFTFAVLTSTTPAAVSTMSIALRSAPLEPDISTSGASNSLWFAGVLAFWLSGVILLSLRVAGGWLLASWSLSNKARKASLPLSMATLRLARELKISRAVRIYESAQVAVPFVFGMLRPIILVPTSAVTGLSQVQLEAILAHELAHVARHDFFVNCLQSAIEVVLFYHPAIWWLSRRIRQEREICCDELAASICGDRLLYSRALLALEEGRQEFALAATGGDLKSRIEHLLRPSCKKPFLMTLASPVLIMATLLVCAIGVTIRAQENTGVSHYDLWLKQDVAYIITAEERKAWELLRYDAEREMFIVQFWKRRDPSPDTEENEAKNEHYRRIDYANQRFQGSRPGWATARGRIYILSGPPDEIESHPKEMREDWRYQDGRTYEFTGTNYELAFQQPAVVGTGRPRLMERISVDRVAEPKRTYLRERLAQFVGQPMSNKLIDQIRGVGNEIDQTLTYQWTIDPVTRQAAVDLMPSRN